MRVLIDACVLVPALTRALVMEGVKVAGVSPLWSDAIVAEWVRAVGRISPSEGAAAQTEALLMQAAYPNAIVPAALALEDSLYLPDENDRHVLASAITGQADRLLTFNTKDFPTRTLSAHGIERVHPDSFLWEIASDHEGAFTDLVASQSEATGRMAKALLRSSHLPRLAKLLLR